MNNKNLARFAIASTLATTCSIASAQWYVGAQVGQARGGPDASHISESFVGDLGFLAATTSTDRTDTAWRAFGGYQILPWLAAEAAYVDLGKSRWTTTVTPAGTMDASLRSRAWTIGPVARFPITPMFAIYGRISAASVETKGSFRSTGFVELRNNSRNDRRTVPAYAAGLEVSFLPRLGARIEYERFSKISSDELGGKFDVDMWSVGLRYNF